MLIPQPLNILPDETLYSYILRLADYDHIDYNIFTEAYVWPNQNYNQQKSLRLDSFENMKGFFDSVSYLGDSLEIFKSNTVYPAIAPFINIFRQEQILNVVFAQNQKYSNLLGNISSFISDLRLCPECIEEDETIYGTHYFHREHQIPNVCVCHKHKKPLLKFKPINGFRYDNSLDNFLPIKESSTSIDCIYSAFVYDLLKIGIQSYEEATTNLIIKKIRSDYYNSSPVGDKYQTVIDDLKDKGYEKIISDDISRTIKEIIDKGRGSIYARIALVCALYDGDAERFERDLTVDNVLRNEFFQKSPSYSILSDFNTTGVTLRHDKCGTIFLVTPEGFIQGWKCPKCNKNIEQEQFEVLCRKLTDNKYIPKSNFENKRKQITLKHKVCGELYTVNFLDFLYKGSRCPCENQYTERKIKAKLRKNGFELILFNGYSEPATLLHTKMHHTFSVSNIKSFFRTPFCHICEQNRLLKVNPELSKQNFIDEMNSLVGEEYSLCGEYINAHTNVKIMHNAKTGGCGETFKIRPDSFLIGIRCPHCRTIMPYSDFVKYVSEVSNGKYSVKDINKHNQYMITNNENNKSRILKKQMILQELRRVDPRASKLP